MGKFANVYYNGLVISEAFSASDMQKAVRLIKNYLQKKIGQFYEVDTQEFKNKFGSQVGIRYAIGNTKREIRFNWLKNAKSAEMTSIDVWGDDNNPVPAIHIDTQDISMARVLPELVQLIMSARPGTVSVSNESVYIEGYESLITEAKAVVDGKTFKSQKDAIVYLVKDKGMSINDIVSTYGFAPNAVKYHAKNSLEAVAGVPETVVQDKSVSDAIKKTKSVEYADPAVIYQDLEDLINLVISGVQPSLVISGGAGTGKTFTVKQLLKAAGMTRGNDYKIIKGQTTPFGLYSSLFLNKNNLIIFDDTDSIWKDKVAVNILKAALDSDEERIISWQSKNTYDPDLPPYEEMQGMTEYEMQRQYFADREKLPNEFLFEGKVIFLTNLRQDQLDQAVKNRSYVIDVTLSPEDVIKRVRSIIPNFTLNGKEISAEIQLEAFEAFKDITKVNSGYISVRTYVQFLKTRSSGSPRWKELALKYST